MAPLPVNNTARYIVTYNANGHQHDTTFRYDDGGDNVPPPAGLLLGLNTLFGACGWAMPTDWELVSGKYIPSGSTISITTGLPADAVVGLGAPSGAASPGYFDFVGRSVGGRQARFFMLGCSVGPRSDVPAQQDYRILEGEDARVGIIRAALDVLPVVAIDGLEPNWYGYMNVGYNAYWQKAVRR